MSNDRYIWDYLISRIPNPYGVAGLMGNLFAESRLDPKCITGLTALTKEQYAYSVTSGLCYKDQFAHDGIAFGLAQWRYYSRKEALWDHISKASWQADLLEVELEFMIEELKTYKTVWKTLQSAKTVKEASDIVMLKYEKPGNVNEAMKTKRAAYGEGYFKMFANQPKELDNSLYLETVTDKVNAREGNGRNYGILMQIPAKGIRMKYVAKSENGWYAVVLPGGKKVGWIDGGYLKEV